MRKVFLFSLIAIAAILYLLQSGDNRINEKATEGQAKNKQANNRQSNQALPNEQSVKLNGMGLDSSSENKSSSANSTSRLNLESTDKHETQSANSEIQIPHCVEKDVADDELDQISQDWEEVMQQVDELNEKASELDLGDSELELARILARYVDDESGKIEAIASYLNIYPHSEIATLVLLMECSSNPKHSYCERLTEEELANENRYSFSHMLNLIALVIQAGDRENEADRLMTESTSLPNFQEYYSSIIELMYRYYSILGAPQNKMDKIGISVTVASANFINFYPVIQYCKAHAGKRQLVAESCISIGERLEKFGETMIAQIFGAVFQIEAYKSLGDTENADAVEARKDAMNAYRASDEFTRSASLIQYDEQVLDTWLNSLLSGTEKSAFDAVIDKAKELASDPNYNPCKTKLGSF